MSFAMPRPLPAAYSEPKQHCSNQAMSKIADPSYPSPVSQGTIQQYFEHANLLKDLPIEQIAANIRSGFSTAQANQSEITFAAAWLLRYCETASESDEVDAAHLYTLYSSSPSLVGLPLLSEASFAYLTQQLFYTHQEFFQGQAVYIGLRFRPEYSELGTAVGDPHGPDPVMHRKGLLSESRSHDSRSISYRQGSLSQFQQPLQLRFQGSPSSDLYVGFELIKFLENYPEGHDPHIVDATRKKYFEYCQRLIQSFGSLNLKEFTCFLQMIRDQLPSPMFEILNSPQLVHWVQETDFAMYKEMLRLLSPLVLREIPPRVLTGLHTLSKTIVREAMELISDAPSHFFNAKSEPVQTFARLLDRFLRVNESARNAANFLSDRDTRQLILNDFRCIDLFALVARTCLCQPQDVYNVLNEDIIALLNLDSYATTGEHSMSSPTPSGRQIYRDSSSLSSLALNENALEAWAQYFSELPPRFGSVDARFLVLCLGQVGDAVIREVTRNEGASFSALWVIKCWIDEWIMWNGEQNAFLCNKNASNSEVASPNTQANELSQ
ncbi:Protein sak1 [Neolecta irregularis DAH-3]|uniref:Protein sak1 n=1 Tax=Neolecta irregularis (strain DAH-3) TaxID=1198029 RepID=A0A1U7LQA9_NEOID|nr:Protein sak1 [Neolecta irregularis DAH-3]|eukprot:OLL24732.1 Protein sak1 [Neolecta irregularis DAH-3]